MAHLQDRSTATEASFRVRWRDGRVGRERSYTFTSPRRARARAASDAEDPSGDLFHPCAEHGDVAVRPEMRRVPGISLRHCLCHADIVAPAASGLAPITPSWPWRTIACSS